MSDKTMIQLDNLKKYFSISKATFKKNVTKVKAVDDITLTIKEGEIVGLVGRIRRRKNYSGKSDSESD